LKNDLLVPAWWLAMKAGNGSNLKVKAETIQVWNKCRPEKSRDKFMVLRLV
jgi:hypothetical protein